MNRFLNIIEDIDTRLLVLGAVLLVAVVVALVKATGALSGTTQDPTYRNTPAQAFVPPSSVTLVDATRLQQVRLPDDDYVAVVGLTRPLLNGVAQLTVTAAQLRQAGMSAANAQGTVTTLLGDSADLSSRHVSVDTSLSVTPGADANSAEVSAGVQYSSAPNGQPPETASMDFSYTRSGAGVWQLQTAVLDVQTASLGGGGDLSVGAASSGN